MPFEFSLKKSNFDLILRQMWHHKVQMSFPKFERAFLPLQKAEIRITIDLQMTKISLFEWLNLWWANPLFKFNIQSVINKKTKTPNFSFSRRREAADLYQTLHEDRGCPYHFCTSLIFSIGPVVSEPGDSENFGGNAYNFFIYQPNRTKC